MENMASSQPSTPRSPSSKHRRRDKEEEKMERVNDLIYNMNDVANDGQDLAMQMRELICDQPAVSSLAQDLASNLSLFGRTLRELALYLGTPAAPFASTTIEVVEVTLDHAEELFDQVDEIMYRFEKDPDRDFIYCFKDTKILRLSAKLESSRLTLAVILQILQLRALMNLQEMEDIEDRALRHRIQDLRLEAQSLVLDESWARKKERLMEENNLVDLSKDETPIMPRHTMTEAAAAVTLLLEQLTELYRSKDSNGKGRVRSKSEGGGRRDSPSSSDPPNSAPLDGPSNGKDQVLETIAKAALAAGVLGAWKSRSKVPVPKGMRQRTDRMKQRAKPKHGASLLSSLGERIETIAPVALAAGAYEIFKNRKAEEGAKERGKRFVQAARGAAFDAAGSKNT